MFRLIFMIAYKETVHASCYESLSVQWFRRRTKLSRFLLCSFLSYFCRGQALFAGFEHLRCYCYYSFMENRILCFNALTGLSCYMRETKHTAVLQCFNALTGLSCYDKNVQYFKFFMILFIHTCYL